MAEQLDPKELVSFKELLMANSIQNDAAVQLLIEKGFFTEAEYFSKLKKVLGQYEKRGGKGQIKRSRCLTGFYLRR